MDMHLNDPCCLIIDEDRKAADELLEALLEEGLDLTIMTLGTVQEAEKFLVTGAIDLLFIAVRRWDDYQVLMYGKNTGPGAVIFLSDQQDLCAFHLDPELDFHLQPPYGSGVLCRIRRVLLNPTFRPRPLDFFFLKAGCGYHVIRYTNLLMAYIERGRLIVETELDTYEVEGTLEDLERRMPIPFYHQAPQVIVFQTLKTLDET